MTSELRDILYFDFEKAASLISQTEGGLATERTEQSEQSANQRNIRNYDLLKVFKAEFGGIEAEKRSTLETKVLHHDLLSRLEDFLFDSKYALDMNQVGSKENLLETRAQFENSSYLRAEGWCAIEDFDRIYEITEKFNDLLSFVRKSELDNVSGINLIKERLKELDLSGKNNSKEFKDLNNKKKEVERQTKKEIEWSKLPPELSEGIRNWIDTLSKHRLNIRLVPFVEHSDLQVIANLKRNCFVDEDLDHLLFGYSAQPNIKLSVFGLVTSVPSENPEGDFNIYEGNSSDDEDSEENRIEIVEKAFSALFPAIRGMEQFTSFHHYPRIVIHPIAVYRTIRKPESVKN